jgi:predicted transcriptional regulator
MGYIPAMTATDLKDLLERAQAWPKEAQDELVAVANQIESEMQGRHYLATRQELRIIDAAMASIDAGEAATDDEIEKVFAKFRP